MNESDKQEELQEGESRESNACPDPYLSESSQDIYTTPEVVETAVVVEEAEPSAVVADTHGLFSGNQSNNAYGAQPPHGDQRGAYDARPPYGSQNDTYGGQPPYGNQNSSYGGQPPYGNQNCAYGGQPPYGNQGGAYSGQPPYGDQGGAYSGQPPYGNQGGAYSGQPPYGNQGGAYSGQPPYGDQGGAYSGQPPYGNQGGAYGGQPPYGNWQAGGGYGGQPPFGGPPYDNPYSPYAGPQKKQNTGLIVGIVIGIIVLFLVAVFALASKAVNLLSERERQDTHRDVYDFDDYDYNYHDDDYYDYDDYDFDYDDDYNDSYDFGYGDFYGDGYSDDAEYNDQYYDLHNEIRSDLSYQVELEDFEYETDDENVVIMANIPVISGEKVPNLDKINEEIREEVEEITELFEEEYESHVRESEDHYFIASLVGYVTYMDEDKLSIAYQEEIYSDNDGGVYLESINIDINNGVILDNEDILAVDDAFSVEFRKKNDEQNGEIPYLTYMTDQQITNYFKSDDVIVFYTPKGMEIGFNYEEGWVTVTYEDYEKYLKVF